MSEYIFNGAYGCVIHPNIDCNQNFGDRLKITKFFYKKEDYEEELILQNIIEKIDQNSKFSVKKINHCKIKLLDKTKERIKNLKKCKLKSNNVFIITYDYGGIDIYNLFTEKKYAEILKNIDFKEFLKKFINIFEGVCEIDKNNYIHFDIRLPNILYNHETKKFVIIDFGIMKNKNNEDDINYLNYEKINNANYPNEYNINTYNFYNLFKSNSNLTNSKMFYYYFIEENINKIKNNNIIKLSEYLLSDDDDNNIIRDISKIDVYMLGLCLLHILIFININNPRTKFPDKIFDLISKMIDKKSQNRITIQNATEEYKLIIDSI